MRTSEQTYLAKLGFGDPDRKNELHDWTCEYLAQPEKAAKLIELVYRVEIEKKAQPREENCGNQRVAKDLLSEEYLAKQAYGFSPTLVRSYGPVMGQRTEATARLSQAIMGGYNNNNIIGYLDVLIRGDVFFTRERKQTLFAGGEQIAPEHMRSLPQKVIEEPLEEYGSSGFQEVRPLAAAVEVKAGRVSLPAVIQQFETYCRYATVPYVLCTLYPLKKADKALLAQHGYQHIYVLPEHVREFMARR